MIMTPQPAVTSQGGGAGHPQVAVRCGGGGRRRRELLARRPPRGGGGAHCKWPWPRGGDIGPARSSPRGVLWNGSACPASRRGRPEGPGPPQLRVAIAVLLCTNCHGWVWLWRAAGRLGRDLSLVWRGGRMQQKESTVTIHFDSYFETITLTDRDRIPQPIP